MNTAAYAYAKLHNVCSYLLSSRGAYNDAAFNVIDDARGEVIASPELTPADMRLAMVQAREKYWHTFSSEVAA